MRLRLLSVLSVLHLLGCGADSTNDAGEAGPTTCADLKEACAELDPAASNSDPLNKCRLAGAGDDDTDCAAVDELHDCLERCDAAQ